MSVTGSVTATDVQGQQRQLERGSEIRQGDRIVTGEGALVQVRTVDGGYLSVRSATEMAIERFNHDEKDSANSSVVMALIKGGFRSITGLIGRTNPNAYSVRTSTATVGIRGTDHEPVLILPPPPGTSSIVPGPAPGLYDKVNDGETFIRTQQGVLALTKGQIGFTPHVADRPPQVLPTVPDFYRIELKTDAREQRDSITQRSGDGDAKGSEGQALRPSLAARREALKEAAVLTLPADTTLKESVLTSPTATTALKEAIVTSPLTSTAVTTLKDAAATSSVLTSPTATTNTTTSTTTLKSTIISPATTTTIRSILTK